MYSKTARRVLSVSIEFCWYELVTLVLLNNYLDETARMRGVDAILSSDWLIRTWALAFNAKQGLVNYWVWVKAACARWLIRWRPSRRMKAHTNSLFSCINHYLIAKRVNSLKLKKWDTNSSSNAVSVHMGEVFITCFCVYNIGLHLYTFRMYNNIKKLSFYCFRKKYPCFKHKPQDFFWCCWKNKITKMISAVQHAWTINIKHLRRLEKEFLKQQTN